MRIRPGAGIRRENAACLDSTDADSLTQAEIAGRRQVFGFVECLRMSGDDRFAQLFVANTGPFVAGREGRRVHGLYTLTAKDARHGQKFEDGICEVHSSYRVTGNAVPLGQVAGSAAALACKEGVPVSQIDARRVSQITR